MLYRERERLLNFSEEQNRANRANSICMESRDVHETWIHPTRSLNRCEKMDECFGPCAMIHTYIYTYIYQ